MIRTALFAVICLGAILLLRRYCPEFAAPAGILAGAALLSFTLPQVLTLVNASQEFFDRLGTGGGYFPALLRVVGIALVTQFAADACRDSGESSLAAQTEFAGKILMILCALPILRELLSTLTGF